MFYAYKDNKNIAGALTKEALVSLCEKMKVSGYEISQQPPQKNIDLTAEQQKAMIKKKRLKAVDDYMDKTVRERGYDNIAKCVTYEGDEDPIFNAEGTAAKKWRSKVYRACYNILSEVEAGNRPIPTVEELLAELPKIDWGDEV